MLSSNFFIIFISLPFILFPSSIIQELTPCVTSPYTCRFQSHCYPHRATVTFDNFMFRIKSWHIIRTGFQTQLTPFAVFIRLVLQTSLVYFKLHNDQLLNRPPPQCRQLLVTYISRSLSPLFCISYILAGTAYPSVSVIMLVQAGNYTGQTPGTPCFITFVLCSLFCPRLFHNSATIRFESRKS